MFLAFRVNRMEGHLPDFLPLPLPKSKKTKANQSMHHPITSYRIEARVCESGGTTLAMGLSSTRETELHSLTHQ
jgi:hypothetical protein